jgi:hypothetical protein
MDTPADNTEFIHRLWDELADFDAAHSDEALAFLMEKLCILAGAWNILWMGAVRLDATFPGDPIKGWRPRIIRHLHSSPSLKGSAQAEVEKLELGVMDITTIRNVEKAGVFRANRLCIWSILNGSVALLPCSYRGLGARTPSDRLPVNEDAELVRYFPGTDRPPFTGPSARSPPCLARHQVAPSPAHARTVLVAATMLATSGRCCICC